MTLYHAIILTNAIVSEKTEIKSINYLVLTNLIGDCFRALKMGRELKINLSEPFIELVIDKWLHYKKLSNTIITAVYLSAKNIFEKYKIEMD